MTENYKPIKMFIQRINKTDFIVKPRTEDVTMNLENGSNIFLPQLEEQPVISVGGRDTVMMPKLTPAPKNNGIKKRRNSEYQPKKKGPRVSVSQDDCYLPPIRRRRTKTEILNEWVRDFAEKQKEELSRIQSVNQESRTIPSLIKCTETETRTQLQPSTASERAVLSVANDQKQSSDVFKAPLETTEIVKKWPRVKTVAQVFHRVSNIAYTSTRFQNLFKCCTSSCTFKTTKILDFKEHLTTRHCKDETLNCHNKCNICNSSIDAFNLSQELVHMMTFHVQRSETISNLIKILEGTTCEKVHEPCLDHKAKVKVGTSQTHGASSVFNTPPYTKEDENRAYNEVDVELNMQKFFGESPKKIDFSECTNQIVPKTITKAQMIKEKYSSNDINSKPESKSFSTKENDSSFSSKSKEETAESSTPKEISTEASPSMPLLRAMPVESSDEISKQFKRPISLDRRLREEKSRKIVKKKQKEAEAVDFVQQLIDEEKSSLSVTMTSPRAAESSPSYQLERSASSFELRSPSELTLNTARISSSSNQIPSKISRTVQLKMSSAQLMPWISTKNLRDNEKYGICYEKMLTKNSLFANFKCMGLACSFTTSKPDSFLSHLCYHENDSKPDVFAKFCSYCPFKGNNAKDLTRHIYNIHTNDIFQCPKCFFRSREKLTCYKHIEKQHNSKDMKILQCPGNSSETENEKQKELMMNRLKLKRCEFVVPLRCQYSFCNQKYFLVEDLLEHLKSHAESENEQEQKSVIETMGRLQQAFDTNSYGMIQCLFCLYGAATVDSFVGHIVEHPSETNYCCKRQRPLELSNSSPFSIDSTNIFRIELGENIKIETFEGDSEVLIGDNFKRIFDQDLKTFLNEAKVSSV